MVPQEQGRRADPRKQRNYWLLSNYGITADQWDELLAAQGYRCGICGAVDPGSKKGWHTDHCHETGAVRGILCHLCNTLIGSLGDTADAVRARVAPMLAYLESRK